MIRNGQGVSLCQTKRENELMAALMGAGKYFYGVIMDPLPVVQRACLYPDHIKNIIREKGIYWKHLLYFDLLDIFVGKLICLWIDKEQRT